MHASLGFIGRAHIVDCEDLPEDDVCESFSKFPIINYENHKTLVSLLSEKTKSLYFFQRSFLRFNFTKKSFHCYHNVTVDHNIHKIIVFNRLLHELELQNFMALKLSEFYNLISQITRLIIHEHVNLKLARNDLPHDSRLECLRGFCESLRICFNNIWSLSSFVQTNVEDVISCSFRYRQSLLKYASLYQLLTTQTIQLSQEFVSNGLLVLSHSDLLKYTHDDLWEIARGVEEYNIVVEHTLFQKRLRLLSESCLQSPTVGVSLASINAQMDRLLSGIKTMSFGKILSKLASERSLLIAHSVHNFFYNSPIIGPRITHFLHSVDLQSPQQFELDECLSSMKRDSGSPVNDYLRLEYEFTSNFLDIISQSTEMLQQLSANLPARKLRKEDTLDNFMVSSTSSIKCAKKASGGRKGVQWSDHTDVSLRHQVIGRYLAVLWKLVNDLLLKSKYNSRYHSNNGLGSWLILDSNCRKIVGIIVERVAKPDLFPIGFIPVLVHQAEIIEYENVLLLWDQGMCTSALLNCVTLSMSQIRLDDVSVISAMIYRYLLSHSKQLKLNNSKGNVLQSTSGEEIYVTATILSLGLCSLHKCGEKLSDLVNVAQSGENSYDPSKWLWPLIYEWALMETYFTDTGFDALTQWVPNFVDHGTLNKLKINLLEDYKTNCSERVHELLDIGQMQSSLSMVSCDRAPVNSTPSAYVQGAILGVLEHCHRSITWDFASSMQDALSVTIDIFCVSWLKKIELLSIDNCIFDPSQLRIDISLVREWINSKDNIPEPMKTSLLQLDSVLELEHHVCELLQPNSRGTVEHDSNYLQRQTSEMGLKVVKGWVRLCDDLCSKTRHSADMLIQSPPLKLTPPYQFHNYFRSQKYDKK